MNSKLPEEEIFHAARQIRAGNRRDSLVAALCGDNQDLKRRVEAMLEVQFNDQDYLNLDQQDDSDNEHTRLCENASEERIGDSIGPFVIREKLGEGGMGVVYVAQQQEPIKRKVALKVIKPGMDSEQVIARFEVERQALAIMDHPNIARVVDAGATPSGRPYFAMDVVRGTAITDYCQTHQLSLDAMLRLFLEVCYAVQHAHMKGIIHRDLKPSNILVTRMGDRAIPKVIDFGLAKAMGQSLTDASLYTNLNQLVGTPLYMSPEQAEMSTYEVDTRSDVYSLGVMLYELVTGETPIERSRLSEMGYDEIRRVLREEIPQRPSERISTIVEVRGSTLREGRRSSLLSSRLRIKNELDWIVLKALEKDAGRRYQSVSEFASDIERFLNGEAVKACPPSIAYRTKKVIQRYRVGLLTGGLVVAVMIVGLVSSLIYANRASLAAIDAKAARASADKEAKRAMKLAKERDAVAKNQQFVAERAVEAEKEQRELKEEAYLAKYRYGVRLAQTLIEKGDSAAALAKLVEFLPLPNNPVRPGWAWYYLLGKMDLGERSWQANQKGDDLVWVDDGRSIFTTSSGWRSDGKLWDPKNGNCLATLVDWYQSAGWNEKTKRLANLTSNQLRVYDLEARKEQIFELSGRSPDTMLRGDIVWNDAGSKFAAVASNDKLGIWSFDGTKPQLLKSLSRGSNSFPCGWNSGEEQFAMLAGVGAIEYFFGIEFYSFGHEIFIFGGKDFERVSKIEILLDDLPARTGKGAWHPTSNLLAVTLRNDNGLVLVDTDKKEVIKHIGKDEAIFRDVEFSSDGKWLAAAAESGRILIWQVENDFLLKRSYYADNTFTVGVAWSPDSTRIASLGIDGKISVRKLDLEVSVETRTSNEVLSGVSEIAWSTSDVLRCSTKNGRVLDYSAPDQKETIFRDEVEKPRWRMLASSFAIRTVPTNEWLVANAECLQLETSKKVRFDDCRFTSVSRVTWALNADGSILAARYRKIAHLQTGFDQVAMIDVRSGDFSTIKVNSGPFECNQMAFSPDGRHLAILGPGLNVSNIQTGARVLSLGFGRLGRQASLQAVEWSSDGRKIVVTTEDGREYVVDFESRRTVGFIRTHLTKVPAVAWHPKQPLVASGGRDKVVVWSPESFEAILAFEVPHPVEVIRWSPDGKRLAALDDQGKVYLWDAAIGFDLAASDYVKGLQKQRYAKAAEQVRKGARQTSQRGDVERAIQALKPWVKPDEQFDAKWAPRNVVKEYYKNLIQIDLEQEDYPNAISNFRRLKGDNPEEASVLLLPKVESTVRCSHITSIGESYIAMTTFTRSDLAPSQTFDDDRDIAIPPFRQQQQLLVKYDADGKFEWQIETSDGSPKHMDQHDGSVYLGFENAIVKLDAANGKTIWRFDVKCDELAVAKDGTCVVLIRDRKDLLITVGGKKFRNSEEFENFYVMVVIGADGKLLRSQRIGSDQRFEIQDIEIEDSSADRSEWQVVGTGNCIDTVYFGDADELESESTACSSNVARNYIPGRDDHLLVFSLSLEKALLEWAKVYEGRWGQKGLKVQTTSKGSIDVIARTFADGPGRNPPGVTVFDSEREDGSIADYGDFVLRLKIDGSFGGLLPPFKRYGTYKFWSETKDGILLSVFPCNRRYGSNDKLSPEISFGNYLLNAETAHEYVFEVANNFTEFRPLLLNESRKEYKSPGYEYSAIRRIDARLFTTGDIRLDLELGQKNNGQVADELPCKIQTHRAFSSTSDLPLRPNVPFVPSGSDIE